MSVAQTLAALGGCATTKELRVHHAKREIAAAVASSDIVRVGHGRYALGSVEEHARVAHRWSAVRSHLSGALAHGWKVKTAPDLAQLTFPRNRKLRPKQRAGLIAHWADATSAEKKAGVTAPLRTVLDCAREFPFDEALAVADSALRSGKVKKHELITAAAQLRGPGSRAARRVAQHADARAANPLESVLRALAIEEGFAFTPQLLVADHGLFAVVDLGDESLRLVLEAEGYQTHGTRSGLRKDCRRHTEFAVFGWDSMRYAYEDVMFHQDWTRWTLRAWRDTKQGRVPEAPPSTTWEAA